MPGAKRKIARDLEKLSGKPLAETLERSTLDIQPNAQEWVTSADLVERDLTFTPSVIYDMNVFLLKSVNLKSSCLFRADILFDSAGILKTPELEEREYGGGGSNDGVGEVSEHVEPMPACAVPGFRLTRTVVRRFIPRNPKLDRTLEQTCHFYEDDDDSALGAGGEKSSGDSKNTKRILLIMTPHTSSKEEIPFYHPILRRLALHYHFKHDATESETGQGELSIHFLPYPDEPISTRLERTLSGLLNTQIRLARNAGPDRRPDGAKPNPIKDNVIPQHRVQNTYSLLKSKYAADLCERWVEDTEPSKHVFEDLVITSFFIELWRSMYGVAPIAENEEKKDQREHDTRFPGFVDVACGNGVLVYVLLMEGYQGWGFDARRRKSWSIFPEFVQEKLKEAIYIPKPFHDALPENDILDIGVETLTGMFSEDTFIISNHADELTVWTPLMAALSNPQSPHPFLSIPCCSHSLSGTKYRYPPPDEVKTSKRANKNKQKLEDSKKNEPDQNPQPQSGDLKALRVEKQEALTDIGMYSSTYGSLTAKTMTIAAEAGYDVERTLIRIPSTRNMGVIGGRKATAQKWARRFDNSEKGNTSHPKNGQTGVSGNTVTTRIDEIVSGECSREGGVEAAAKAWVERAKGLHRGKGRGNDPRH